jgi:hypothetical protein
MTGLHAADWPKQVTGGSQAVGRARFRQPLNAQVGRSRGEDSGPGKGIVTRDLRPCGRSLLVGLGIYGAALVPC